MHDLNMDSAIKSYACNTAAEVQLMTAVAEVKGQERRAKVRTFIDLGLQSSLCELLSPDTLELNE